MSQPEPIEALRSALQNAWSVETSSKWLPENPAKGQCSVSALVVQDLLGGDIAKTDVDGAWHFYNLVDGRRLDFSQSQFPVPPTYLDLRSDRSEAFSDTSLEQYRILKERIQAMMSKR
ncbi:MULTISPECIES: hypothetical protein [unclassified Mesorhizobium]|uniref:YunG family protein n=1 Tax=unclassified Mesorhizobium TaxID=325217 RepID=UPI000BAFB8A2|nr:MULTISPECIES: hypothetical protein [unclassified Mesorhizobium]TGT56519.1 hypothetical protein EN813_041895 [Mesorhizobium sp. M00.F.Ca.ET.170.01.1.1]AZO11577.1 hypothetical protein EJ074_22620 [Mesorhizobium sp. M3A.F.Ca.ET.080.04.2.1]PBB86800.1 hypothetical protein CK216_11095 [Mesorhizobium sp. WSM3876]RWB72787.1 MAG: hypothetical protein EOQ49_12565 [Mesorhizobium sp.]RWB86939.1 MAG: hypothetical protein EOQ52_16825 [Mesorhizobium sp.]